MTKRYGKHKRRHRRTRHKGPSYGDPKPRFPRMAKDEERAHILTRLAKLRVEYPPPYYDKWRDGAYDPTESVLKWLVDLHIDVLRRKCKWHGLADDGNRFDLTKRMYLHFRSSKLRLGYPWTGYGPEHRQAYLPECTCGRVRKIVKRFPREIIHRFPRTKFFPRPYRFARLPRDPRFWDKEDFALVAHHMEWYEKFTGVKLSIMAYCDVPPRFCREMVTIECPTCHCHYNTAKCPYCERQKRRK